MPQVYFNTNKFKGASVPRDRSLSLDDFYFEVRNILRMKSLSPLEKREAVAYSLRNSI